MAIRSVASSNGFLPVTATAPAGTAAGDRLLALVISDAAATGLPAPSGWTTLQAPAANAASGGLVLAVYEVVSSTGAESYTWTLGTAYATSITIIAITGATGAAAAISLVTNDGLQYTTPVSPNFEAITLANTSDLFAVGASVSATSSDVLSWDLFQDASAHAVTFTSKYDVANPTGSTTAKSLTVSAAQSVAPYGYVFGDIWTTAYKAPNSGLSSYLGLLVAVPLNPPATLTTLNGPTSGYAGTASSNFTVTVDHPVTGAVTVTPSDAGAGGGFSPSTLSFSGGTTSLTFTYNAPGGIASAGTGTRTVSITNNGGLSNPSPIAFSARGPAFAISDVTTAGWTPTALRGTPLALVVDEVSASDLDYIQSPVINGSQGPVILQLNESIPAGSLTIPIRAQFTGTAGQVRVLMTDNAGAVQGTSAWQALTASFALYSLTVTTTGTSTRIRIEVQ